MAALPPAGVNLQAKGFQDYIKKLQQIDKQQREVFDRQFKGTDLSYKQVVSASKAYQRELANELKALQRNERERARLAEQAAKEQSRAAADRRQSANLAFVGVAAGLGVAAVKGLDLAQQGAAFEAQEQAAFNLAASYGQLSSEIVAAMQKASNGVLSNSDIIQAANKALLLEVAKTPEEFDRITRNALVLGRTLGLTAPESIDQFTTALGRKSILILDNFGLKTAQVNEELDRLGRQQFGKGLAELSAAQKDALFIEAALAAADKRVEAIGDNGDTAAIQIERMGAAAENAKTQFALLVKDVGQSSGLFAGIANSLQGIADSFQGARVGFGGGSIQDQIAVTRRNLEELRKIQEEGPADFTDVGGVLNQVRAAFSAPQGDSVADQIAQLEAELERLLAEEKALADEVPKAVEKATDAVEDNTDALRERQRVIRQAEQLALQFARAQEDAERQFLRAQQDATRQFLRQQEKLNQDQAKARDKLLRDQQKELEQFEADAVKERAQLQADAVKKEAKLRQDAAKKQQDEQRKLLQELKQAEERFLLDRQQARRRFNVQDRRLRSEGDILGLMDLRENFELEQQEAKENFDLQQKQTKDSALLQQQEQAQALQDQLKELRDGLAEQNAEFEAGINERRAQLLTGFDEEFSALAESQAEQRAELQRSYQEQLENLRLNQQRQEEDLRLSQQRQLEDLGRSFVEMESITEAGASDIASKLEEAFGIEGTADLIMQGFEDRTTNRFQDLFKSIGDGLKQVNDIAPTGGAAPHLPVITKDAPAASPFLPVITKEAQPAPVTLPAPVNTSTQNINHNFTGSMNFTGNVPAGMDSVAVKNEIIEEVRIALQRVKRRG